eukprot:2836635-Rhodomonas_salina.1
MVGTPATALPPPLADPSLEQQPHCLRRPHPHLNPCHVPLHRQYSDLPCERARRTMEERTAGLVCLHENDNHGAEERD